MATYYIEVLDNLGIVDIFVEAADGQNKQESGVGQESIELVDDSTLIISGGEVISLPVSVVLNTATRSSLPNSGLTDKGKSRHWIRIRASISQICREHRQHNTQQLITSVAKPVTSSLLENIRGISCQNCSAKLDNFALQCENKKPSIRELPSAYWSELVDCWVCHPEEDNIKVNDDLLHIFEPESERHKPLHNAAENTNLDTNPLLSSQMWVGETFILIPTLFLKPLPTREIELAENKRFYNKFSALSCDKCTSVIGEVGWMGTKRIYKLFLHRINFIFPEPR
ncbi:ubiquitin-conjugating enzyme E2-binding protein [Coemansia spiralis]|nr:ubiquitin-conjugating enzyme E2-binding protein [Coemansia spiralis]